MRAAAEAKGMRAGVRSVVTIPAPGIVRLRALADYWRSKCAGRMAPRRVDIDPAEIREHMPTLFMVEVLPRGEYRYRLVGSELVERTGRNATGKILSQLHAERPEVLRLLKARFDQVVAARAPVFSRGEVYWLDGDEMRQFECGYFPLSEDGRTVSIILAELVLFWPDGQSGA
ncbi:MAG: PAS domain-containing protein [Alphaproteobacteria bacterium]|nr:PAS domain-containing protein [Alphaproteobacteria bacterium]